MADPGSRETQPQTALSAKREPHDYPIREYIASMAQQLAMLARGEGDEGLAALLEAAGDRAERALP